MVHNYLDNISNYSSYGLPIGFFTYIRGFASNLDAQIKEECQESKINGSGTTVSNLIILIEDHMKNPYSHKEL